MIKIIDLHKQFGKKKVTKGVSLQIPAGQMTCIVGRSGEGKSVLLKQIIGLIEPTSGKILVNNVDITQLSPRELDEHFKNFGYVFQFAALLDSLNVLENVGITLIENGASLKEVKPIVIEKLRQVNLKEETLYKYPSELSGGMRKRVGLARTLITNPKVILYDEPTTGLDPITSRVIHELMANMQKELQITSVVITHDLEFFNYADNVALLHAGKIQYFGSAKTIWEADNQYIHQFIRGKTEGPMQKEIAHYKNKF